MRDAYKWYESKQPGLGDEFFSSVEECLLKIQSYPLIAPVAEEQCRRASVHRFPFEIFYEPTVNEIAIYAVFHSSQNPAKWQKRLPHNR